MKVVDKSQFMKEYIRLFFIFTDFLDENNINYSLAFGTLLGAYREHGIIPWDFDIDIMMDFDNVDKFLKLKNLPNDFYVHGYHDCEVGHCLTRVYIKKFYQSHGENGAIGNSYFDVFHFRGLKNCKRNFALNNRLFRYYKMIYMKDSSKTRSASKNMFKTIVLNIVKIFLPSTKNLIKKTKIIDSKMIGGNDYMGGYAYLLKRKISMPTNYIPLDFEHHKCLAINNVQEFLMKTYGNNFMTPINDNRGDDFVFFVQEEINNEQ